MLRFVRVRRALRLSQCSQSTHSVLSRQYLTTLSHLKISLKFTRSSSSLQLRAVSSNSRCLNSQALAQAAVKHRMQSLLHSFSVTECLSLTQQAVHQFGVHLLLQHLIQRIRRVTVLLGRTHSLKITQSLVLVWLSVRRLSATDLSSMLRVFRRIQTALTSRQLARTISTQ